MHKKGRALPLFPFHSSLRFVMSPLTLVWLAIKDISIIYWHLVSGFYVTEFKFKHQEEKIIIQAENHYLGVASIEFLITISP